MTTPSRLIDDHLLLDLSREIQQVSFPLFMHALTSQQGLLWLMLLGGGLLYLLFSLVGKQSRSTTHGSAHFASRWEAQRYHHRAGLFRLPWRYFHFSQEEARLHIGTYKGLRISLSARQQESNVLLTAPVGSGKSSCFVIPNLLQEQGQRPLFISDLKGELFDLTAGALASAHSIWLFAPTRPQISQGYNPLAHIKTIEDAQDFADCWVSNTGEGKDPYWANCARLLISALVMHLRVSERHAPFARLSDILVGMAFEEMRQMLLTSPSSIARRETQGFLDALGRNDRLVGSILTDIGNRFQLLASEEARTVTAINELDFEQMIDESVAFYLSIPRYATKRYRPLLACLTMQMFTAWERRGILPKGLACYFDEFTNLGYIPGFADFISSARSKRIAIFMVIQSFSQLVARYGEEDAETITNNAVTHLLLPGAGLQETRYYSERIGDTTVSTATHAGSGSGIGSNHQITQGETRRRLLAPEELRTLPENTVLMVSKASPPLLVKTTPYFRNARLLRLAHLPYHVSQSRSTDQALPEAQVFKLGEAEGIVKHIPAEKEGTNVFFLPE